MTFDEYQRKALSTALDHKESLLEQTIWVLGIAGEAGEVVEKWKKIIAYRDGKLTAESIAELKKEIGDVLWYLTVFAHSLGLTLEEVARFNNEKLASRLARNVIKGQGDDR